MNNRSRKLLRKLKFRYDFRNLFNSFDTSKQGRVTLDFNQFVYCSKCCDILSWKYIFPISYANNNVGAQLRIAEYDERPLGLIFGWRWWVNTVAWFLRNMQLLSWFHVDVYYYYYCYVMLCYCWRYWQNIIWSKVGDGEVRGDVFSI